ncbi:hypothetical protein Tco_1295826 [Tanacetum coccineum]
MQEDRNITMINYTEAEVTGRLVNVLCQVGFTTLTAKFLILEIPIDREAPIMVGHGFLDTIGGNIDIPNRILTTFNGLTRQTFSAARSEKIRIAESDSDDEEDYVIKRNDMGTPIHNSRPIGYQNNTNPAKNMTLSTLELEINPFKKISVWKKAISFLGSLPAKNYMPPRRSSAIARVAAAVARAATAAAAAATPMTAAAVEQLIKARVYAALSNHETLRNNTNGHGDGA